MKTKQRLVKGNKTTNTKIEAKPLTEEQICEFVKYYNQNKSFPGSKIPCTVTGKLTTCVGPWMIKKIKEFGSPEKLLRNYKCRGALKSERQIIKPVSTRAKRKTKVCNLKDEQKNWNIPKVNFTPPRPLTPTEITETTKSQCLRPDIFISNGRHCEGCEFYEICVNSLKCVPDWNKINKKHKK
jgi:hypothetical protein